MDGLKKNLHFVVFGVGALLGIIFLVVGISMRGGTETQLSDALTSLQSVNPPSEGDITLAKNTRARFDSSLEEAEKSLEARGRSLIQGFNPATGAGEFYTNDANPTLTRLKEAFQDLRKQHTLPEPLAGRYRIQDNTRDSEFWTDRDSEMAELNDQQVRDYWIRLRIMEEVAAVCQALVDAGADDGMGVRLISFNFEAIAPIGSQEDMSPWMTMPWSVQMQCSPNFGTLLLSELTSPTSLTMENRRGFPNLIQAYQVQLQGRPSKAKFFIDNEYKKELGHSEDLNPDDTTGRKVREEIEELLEEETTIMQPVNMGLRLRAGIYNDGWRPMVEPEEE